MKPVWIDLSFTCVENNLSPEEKDPQIHVFLDRRFKRRPIKTGLESKKVRVTGLIRPEIQTLPQTTSLVFSGFAWRHNTMGTKCLMDIGFAHIPISALVKGQTQFDLPLLMHTVQNYRKAILKVRVHAYDLAKLRIVPHKFIGSEIFPYIRDTIKASQEMPDTIPGTSNMRIPYDYSESGLELTNGSPLPARAYVMSETPEANIRYFENALETVMRRDDMHVEEFETLNLCGKARVMALVCCFVPQYLDYVSDTVDRNKINAKYLPQFVQSCENFGDGLTTWSGDCEDLGSAILQCYNALLSVKFPKQYKQLREIQRIANQYIPILSLDVVNGAQVKDKDAPKGAHMNDNLVPIAEFRKWVRQSREGRNIDRKISSVYPKKIESNLPFLVGEGTGKLEPLGLENPLLPLMGYVYRCPSLRVFKKPITRQRGEAGSFLLGSLKGFTNYFTDRNPNITYGGLTYTTVTESAGTTRGAYYEDMMNDRKDVGVMMDQPLSKASMEVINEAIMLRDPPSPLILTKEAGHEKNEHLELVVKAVSEFGRQPGLENRHVPLYARPHQISSSLARDMINDFSQLGRVWKFSYRLERMTDEIWGYELRVYVE